MFRLQAAQVQFVEKFREDRAVKADLPRPPIESDAEARLNQGEYCPGLRDAYDRIDCRA